MGSRTIDLLKVTQSKGFTPHSRAGSMRNIVQELFQSWGFSLQRGSEEFPERGLFFGFLENYFFLFVFWKNMYSSWDVTR